MTIACVKKWIILTFTLSAMLVTAAAKKIPNTTATTLSTFLLLLQAFLTVKVISLKKDTAYEAAKGHWVNMFHSILNRYRSIARCKYAFFVLTCLLSGSLSTSFASFTSMNFFCASGLSLFLSGWYFKDSLRKALHKQQERSSNRTSARTYKQPYLSVDSVSIIELTSWSELQWRHCWFQESTIANNEIQQSMNEPMLAARIFTHPAYVSLIGMHLIEISLCLNWRCRE